MNKENKKIYFAAFWILVVFSFFSILNIFKNYYNYFSIKGLNYPREEIKANVVLNKKVNDRFFVCYNDYCKSLEKDVFLNVYTSSLTAADDEFYKGTIRNISVLYPGKYKNIVDNVSIFVGNKKYYYSEDDILDFEQKNVELDLDETDEQNLKLVSIKLPDINNYKGCLNHIIILILSLFYNAKIFSIPYFWLFVAYLIRKYKLKEEGIFISKKIYFTLLGLIFLFGAIFRINQINYYPLWLDEVYVKTVGIKSLLACFQDAGNPPLFYLLEHFVSKISSCDILLRALPFCFGLLFILFSYLIFEKFGKRAQLFAAFFASFNLINIYHSADIRSYSLCMLLCLMLVYYIFKYLDNPNFKNLFYYSIVSIFAINTHYYFSFLIFANFLYAIASLIDSKEKKHIIGFVFSNIITVLSFAPYLYIVYKTALSPSFNSWIEPLNMKMFSYIIKQYFINKYVFLALGATTLCFALAYFLPNKIRQKFSDKYKQREEFLMYLIYSLLLVLILACLISVFVKPILHKRILLSVYGLMFLGEITLISIFYSMKLRFVAALLMFLFFMMQNPMVAKEQYRFDDFMFFVKNDMKQYEDDYEIHCITNDRKEYLDNYPDIKKIPEIKWHFVDTNSLNYAKSINRKDYIKDGARGVIYVHDMSADINKLSMLNPRAYVYNTNSLRIAKLIFKGEDK